MKKSISLLSAVILLTTLAVSAQEEVPARMKIGFDSITPAQSLNHIEFLASDYLEGRDTSSKGMIIARNYGAAMFKQFGLKPAGDANHAGVSYHQVINFLETTKPGAASLSFIADGSTSYFGSSDIKALLTYHLHLNQKETETKFLGSRCYRREMQR